MSRTILITDALVTKLMKEKAELQKKLKPVISEMDKLMKPLQPFYDKLSKLNKEIESVRDEMKPLSDTYMASVKKAESIDAQAVLIDHKITPILLDLTKNKIAEFEEVRNVSMNKNGLVEATIVDVIEEFKTSHIAKKASREANKSKKNG